jgi:hypothetical protein
MQLDLYHLRIMPNLLVKGKRIPVTGRGGP